MTLKNSDDSYPSNPLISLPRCRIFFELGGSAPFNHQIGPKHQIFKCILICIEYLFVLNYISDIYPYHGLAALISIGNPLKKNVIKRPSRMTKVAPLTTPDQNDHFGGGNIDEDSDGHDDKNQEG